ncbi:hypothetical protein [Enterococcus diestrammenae]
MKEDSLLTMTEATAWIASDAELLTILTIIQTWQLPAQFAIFCGIN